MGQFQGIVFDGYLKNLTENKLRSLVFPDFYKRGSSYYRAGAVINPKFYPPNKLTAFVRGNLRSKYIIKIEAEEEDLDCSCTCPTGYEYCKHVVATLLMWINEPEKFKMMKTESSGLVEEEGTGGIFIRENKFQQILMTWEKAELVKKIISLLKENNHIKDVNYIVDFLNRDINYKPEILEKFGQFKKAAPSIMENIKWAYMNLQRFYEDNGTPDEWYYRQNEGFSEEEKELQEDTDQYIVELNEISKFIQVLFDYGLEDEAHQLYDLLEVLLGKTLDPKGSKLVEGGVEAEEKRVFNESKNKQRNAELATVDEFKVDEKEDYEETEEGDFKEARKGDIEIDEDEEDYEDEEDFDSDYIDLSKLEAFREQLRQNYLIRSYDRYDHSTKFTKYLDLYQKQPSETVKQAIWGLYTLDDLPVIKGRVLGSKNTSREFFALIIKLLKKDDKKNEIISICEQFLTAPYKEQVYTHLVKELSEQDPERAIYYCHEALQNQLNTDFFSTTLFDMYLRLGKKEAGLKILTEYYLQKGSNPLYLKLKDLAEELQQWETVASYIIDQLKSTDQNRPLLDFYVLEKRFADAIDLVNTKSVEAYQIIRIADECQSNYLYPEAVNLYKAAIKQLLYPGEGLIGRLNEAAKIAHEMKESYEKMEDLKSFNAYIKRLTTNYNTLYRFRTEFLSKI